ncbi:hypothetical protein GOV12_00555 [Candidatus Pacearchaeota archaeon]|nr:hypothetical protein [Candidatus Pacearchaeota archaeon]
MEINNKKLIKDYFKDYKVIEKNNVLTIPEAPSDFEEIFGMKAPYKLVFSLNNYKIIPNSELITRGSYFLSSIRDSMEGKGQTSLVKLNVKIPLLKVDDLLIGNCSILKKEIKNSYKCIIEFTFFSNSHALNEKKQFFKKYLINMYDDEILDIDINKYKFLKSNKDEIPQLDINKQYKIAKNNFLKYLNEDIKDIKIKLKGKLKTEILRIKEYYSHQIKEKDEEILICKNKINNLKKDLKHTTYERDINTIKRNIRDSETRFEMLKKQGYKERLKEEEKFHFKDEIDKHTLIIENKLVNASIYYYPSVKYLLTVGQIGKNKTKDDNKTVEVSYDSLLEKFDYGSLVCESCKKNNIKEINLCNHGKHLVCMSCLKGCKYCKKVCDH